MLHRILDHLINRQACLLAMRAEGLARQLSGSPVSPVRTQTLVETLAAVVAHLEVLTIQEEAAPASPHRSSQPDPPTLDDSSQPSSAPVSRALEPTPTARELMRLCDILWVARCQNAPMESAAITELFTEIERVLAGEGVTVLCQEGTLDPRTQRVSSTQPTSDATLHHRVCRTLLPGYRFGERVLRPQEVVVARLSP